MSVSYKKLWKLLIDREMTKTQLRKDAKISTGALAKLGKNENVNTEILVKICNTLHCDLSDIMELTQEGDGKSWKKQTSDNWCPLYSVLPTTVW